MLQPCCSGGKFFISWKCSRVQRIFRRRIERGVVMKKDKIETGKVVGTHGVRGALRVQPWCDSPDFLCNFKTLYLKNNGEYQPVKVKASRPHGNMVIMELDGITNIDMAETLRGKVLYLDRKSLDLDDDRYLICDLIGCEVFNVDNNELIGKISDVSKTGANDVWHITNEKGEFLIPAIEQVVISVDVDAEKVVIKLLDGIFD